MVVAKPTPEDVDLKVINYESEDGVRREGFEITSSKGPGRDAPCIIFLHGLRGSAIGSGIAALAYPLARQGVRCISINKRNSGTDYITSNFREIERDIRGVINWTKDKGHKHIVLCGRSLGTVEVAYYQGERNDPDVDSIILVAPVADIPRATKGYFKAVSNDPERAYDEFVEEAQALVDEGRGDEIVALPRPMDGEVTYVPMSAKTFLSYRGPESDCVSLEWIPNVEVPIQLIPHTPEGVLAPPSHAEEIADSADPSLVVHHSPIDSDHFFTGVEEDVTNLIFQFIVDNTEV